MTSDARQGRGEHVMGHVMGMDSSAARWEAGAGPDGVEPGRARAVVRDLFERPGLVVRDLTAPLLVLPDDPDRGTCPAWRHWRRSRPRCAGWPGWVSGV